MRIGFFSDSYFPKVDGVTYTLKSWKERLEEKGHEAYIVYPGSEEYDPEENEIPVRSVRNPFYSGYRIPLPGFGQLPEFDIVHCHTPATLGWKGLIHASRRNIPRVYTHHTPLEEYFIQAVKSQLLARGLGRIYVPLEQLYMRRFDEVTTNIDKGRRDVPMTELAAGIDMEFFKPSERLFKSEKPVIGYSGRVSNEKNVGKILELAERMDARFIIVGEGPERPKLEKGAPENVEFRDFLDREDLPGFYSSLDVFVTASTGDTLGLSTLEANACGTPVVAADVFPFKRTIEDGNGERFDLESVEDLKNKTRIAMKKEYDTRKAVESYSLENTIDRLEEIYEEVS